MLIPAIVFGVSLVVLMMASAKFVISCLEIVQELMDGKNGKEVSPEADANAGKSFVIAVIAFALLFADVFYCVSL